MYVEKYIKINCVNKKVTTTDKVNKKTIVCMNMDDNFINSIEKNLPFR